MKRLLLTALLSVAAQYAPAAVDVGVSINIGDPNFYGRIDIGDFPRPALVYERPVMIERVYDRTPLYLRVPPGHAKHWEKHCREYDACGRPVYFVQERWYNDVYAPRYREHREDRREDRRDDRRDDRWDDRGPGRGHDKGHGKGHWKD